MKRAAGEVQAIVKEFEIGEIAEGKVVKIFDFGALVEIGGGKTGMVHVSEIKDEFVKDITEELKIGDFVRAKVIKIENGRIDLSIKRLKS